MRFVDALPVAGMEHVQPTAMRQDPGETCTRLMSGIGSLWWSWTKQAALPPRYRRASTTANRRTVGTNAIRIDLIQSRRYNNQPAWQSFHAVPSGCMPRRRTTALGCPKLTDLTRLPKSGLAQASPSVSPPLTCTIVLFHCFLWPPFLHFCPRDMLSALHAFRPWPAPDLQSQYTILPGSLPAG